MVFEELLWLLHVTNVLSDFPYQPHLLPVPAKLKANHNPTCLPSVYLLPIHAAVVFFLAAVKCSELHMDTPVVANCSNPWGTFSYGSTCTFHCPEGQLLNGSAKATCRENGRWSAAMPTCQGTYFIWFRTWPWPRKTESLLLFYTFLMVAFLPFSALPACLMNVSRWVTKNPLLYTEPQAWGW